MSENFQLSNQNFNANIGEVFISSEETDGQLECLEHFKGKSISNIGGGYKKLFLIENGENNEGVVNSLHAPEFDEYDYTFQDNTQESQLNNPQDVFEAFENKGSIVNIVAGKKHQLMLSDDNKVYSYGYGEYGSLGLSGQTYSQSPQLLKSISDKKVIQIACGEYHSMLLTNLNDIYAWGRGFEGQLGLGLQNQSSATPKYLKYFYQNPVEKIACGSYHSFAITQQKQLYGWGDSRQGQVGVGRKTKVFEPQLIKFDGNVDTSQKYQSDIRIADENVLEEKISVEDQKIIAVSAGFAHSCALNQRGDIFAWGLNIKGQLGLGDRLTRLNPTRITKDILSFDMPKCNLIVCGYDNSFVIDNDGCLYSWGSKNIGQKNQINQDQPRKIESNTEGRKFSKVFANINSSLFFAQIRIISMRPNSGPSNGGTLVSLIGTGFADTGKQACKFIVGNQEFIEQAQFDHNTKCYRIKTPNFEERITNDQIQWPVTCQIEITIDGKNYIPCENNFLIYSFRIQISSISPKSVSVGGGTNLVLHLQNLDEQLEKRLEFLTVGFQSKNKKSQNGAQSSNIELNENESHHSKSKASLKMSKQSSVNQLNKKSNGGSINPLDISINDDELDKDNWLCVTGTYEKGKITCVVPQLDINKIPSLQFNVDISLNGQQFTGSPSPFRFYDIKISSFEPNNGTSQGGEIVKINGVGLFDSNTKKIKYKSIFGERLIDVNWNKTDKSFQYIVPPAEWLYGGIDPTQEQLNQFQKEQSFVQITMNGVEWVDVGKFFYYDPKIERIGPAINYDSEEQQKHWNDQIDEQTHTLSDEELLKIKEADYEQYRKQGQFLFIYGQNYFQSSEIIIKFNVQNNSIQTKGVFKNSTILGVIIPDIPLAENGLADVNIEISFNGQKYSQSLQVFKYLGFIQNASKDEKDKFEADLIKNNSKKPGKK